MKKRKLIEKREPFMRHKYDPRKYYILALLCSVILAGGFFLAATFHFSSINYGMKNAKLRSKIEGLQSKKRRLLLSREMLLSPSAIKKAARKIGLREVTPTDIEIISHKKPRSSELIAGQETKIASSIKTFKITQTEKK